MRYPPPGLLRAPPPPRRLAPALLAALPASLGVHALLVGLVVASSLISPSAPPRPKKIPPRPVSIRRLDARAWASNRALRPQAAPERPEDLHPRGQVVDVAQGNEQRPRDSKYLAESNNRVEKETRAKEQTARYSAARPKNAPRPEAAVAARGEPEATPPPSGVSLAERYFGRQQATALSPARSPPGEEGTVAAEATGGEAREGGGAPNDALDEVEAGDGTFLNTREWKFAAFFNRVKQSVSAKWDPNARLRARRDGLGSRDRLTVLHVALRPDGTLADVFVAQSCGLEQLDVEAMNAFSKAQPFPNPPAALVQDGFIRFGFSFHVTNEGLAAPLPFRFR